jgi:hypothetical protein
MYAPMSAVPAGTEKSASVKINPLGCFSKVEHTSIPNAGVGITQFEFNSPFISFNLFNVKQYENNFMSML